MNIFDLKITESSNTVIPLSVTSDKDPCIAASYSFTFVPTQGFLEEGTSIEVEVTGGICPFTWTAISPGISLAAASTIGRFNTITCNLVPYDEKASIQVTDSCGNIISTSIPIRQDWDCGCLSGVCAASPDLVITPSAGTDPNAIVDGDAFEVTGGLPPYRWRITGAAVDASVVGTGTIVGFYDVVTGNYNVTISVIDACGKQTSISGTRYVQPTEIISGWIPAPETIVEYNYGCDDDPRWSISCGEIDRRTGLIKNLNGCECKATVTVTVDTGCGDPVESVEDNPDLSILTISGSDAPVVGSIYTAAGGSGDLIFSFDSGTISTTATTCTITSIDSCGVSGTARIGNITVSDNCDPIQIAELAVKLPGGTWVRISSTDYCLQDWECLSSVITDVGGTRYIETWGGLGCALSCNQSCCDFFTGICAETQCQYPASLYLPGTLNGCPSNSLGPFTVIGHAADAIYEWQC